MRRNCLICLLVCMLSSCNNLFWDDELDFQWRLDAVEYTAGVDFDGNPAGKVEKSKCWLSMGRNLAYFENMSGSGEFHIYGSFETFADSIRFDFTAHTNQQSIVDKLSVFGLNSVVSSFRISSVDNRNMVLSGDSTTLYFTRW